MSEVTVIHAGFIQALFFHHKPSISQCPFYLFFSEGCGLDHLTLHPIEGHSQHSSNEEVATKFQDTHQPLDVCFEALETRACLFNAEDGWDSIKWPTGVVQDWVFQHVTGNDLLCGRSNSFFKCFPIRFTTVLPL